MEYGWAKSSRSLKRTNISVNLIGGRIGLVKRLLLIQLNIKIIVGKNEQKYLKFCDLASLTCSTSALTPLIDYIKKPVRRKNNSNENKT